MTTCANIVPAPASGRDAGFCVSGGNMEIYSTKNIHLAAYLSAWNPQLFIGIESDSLPFKFLFAPSALPYVHEYESGSDVVSASRFVAALDQYRRTIAQLRRRK